MDGGVDSLVRIEQALSSLVLGLLLWGPVQPETLIRFVWEWLRGVTF